ncbi:DMT family transporter [Balneatrix alpica]|uniref:DMT family transporter n=1 Tax=Balneatrix alpica TaxID=75684 RepID=A0ABV5Z7U2_9GAMM|nr:DMT family transporter [Balneatrix alpica]
MKGYGFAIATVSIWTGFMLVSRHGGLSTLSAWDMMALRFFPATLLLVPLWWWQGRPSLWHGRSVLLALVGGLGYASLAYQGFRQAPVAHAGVLLPGMLPFVIALLAWKLLDEPLSKARLQGLALMLAGVACLMGDAWQDPAIGQGDVLIFLSALCWSLYTVLAKRWGMTPWQATFSLGIVSALLYAPIYGLFLWPDVSQWQWQDVLLQGVYQGVIATVLAMVLYLQAIKHLGATQMGMMMGLIPPFSALLAVPILGEGWSWATAMGLVLVLGGVIQANKQALLKLLCKEKGYAVREY